MQRIQQQLQQMQQQQQLMNNMQQQRQVPGNSFQNMVSPMDASTGTSARLMAMAGMAGIGNQQMGVSSQSNSVLQNMQAALLQQQSQQPPQSTRQHSLAGLTQHSAMANLNPAAATNLTNQSLQQQQQQMLIQQQVAALQKQQLRNSGTITNNAMAAAAAAVQNMRPGVGSQPGMISQQALKARQQQLLQQMQDSMDGSQHRRTSGSSATGSLLDNSLALQQLGQQAQQSQMGVLQGNMQQQLAHSQLGQQQLGQHSIGHQQLNQASLGHAQFGPASQLAQAATPGHASQFGQQQFNQQTQLSQLGQQMQLNIGQQQQLAQQQSGGLNQMQHQVSHSNDGSASYSQRSSPASQQHVYDSTNNMEPLAAYPTQQQQHQQQSALQRSSSVGSSHNHSSSPIPAADSNAVAAMTEQQQGFLDGRFAGGWQSNEDLPDRRRVICSILEVIRQMRPDTSKLSTK